MTTMDLYERTRQSEQSRRRIWEQRRDSIAELREQFKKDRKTEKESKQDATQDRPEGRGLS
jgi:hypothetical protein